MRSYSDFVKEKLLEAIDNIASDPSPFVRDPERDFCRCRKLNFKTMIKSILSFGSSTLADELLSQYEFSSDFPTVSAFVQQRQKILPEAFRHLMMNFTELVDKTPELFHEYRLISVDGTDLTLPLNTDEPNAFPESKCSLLHLNAFYDLINEQYIDVEIQNGYEENELSAAISMFENMTDRFPAIIVGDRGYENWNLIAHIEEKLFDYVIRVKDINSNGIISTLPLPDNQEFDVTRDVVLTRHHTNYLNGKGKYKYLRKNKQFDFVPNLDSPDYDLTIRFVRFRIAENTYETVATSLSNEVFTTEMIKEIYRMRWGIESSFRQLKHTLGLASFHSKKADCIMQEIYARIIMYNFSMMITCAVKIPEKKCKHTYLINFSQAIKICRHFFTVPDVSPPFDVESMILRFLLPQRKGRNYPRSTPRRGVISFNYRLS